MLDRIADKWTALIIQVLANGTQRYAALHREIGGISQKMLTQTLRSLERDGLVLRKVHPVVPPKVEYSLTRLGRTLIDPLHALCRWSERHLPELQANRTRARTLEQPVASLKRRETSPSASNGAFRFARMSRIFLLSPAYAGGQRARMIMSERAQFDLARRLRSENRPTLGEVFTFLSGLYFRGKLAYANVFAQPAPRTSGVLVITPNRGLVPAASPIGIEDLRDFGTVDIDEDDPRYREPLERDVKKLAKKLTADCEVVLLGSVATGKYVDILLAHFGKRLRFPAEFVGRGDMSRGGLLLRCAVDRNELALHLRGGRGAKRKASAETGAAKIYEAMRSCVTTVILFTETAHNQCHPGSRRRGGTSLLQIASPSSGKQPIADARSFGALRQPQDDMLLV